MTASVPLVSGAVTARGIVPSSHDAADPEHRQAVDAAAASRLTTLVLTAGVVPCQPYTSVY